MFTSRVTNLENALHSVEINQSIKYFFIYVFSRQKMN